jgi:hypothetical protein
VEERLKTSFLQSHWLLLYPHSNGFIRKSKDTRQEVWWSITNAGLYEHYGNDMVCRNGVTSSLPDTSNTIQRLGVAALMANRSIWRMLWNRRWIWFGFLKGNVTRNCCGSRIAFPRILMPPLRTPYSIVNWCQPLVPTIRHLIRS